MLAVLVGVSAVVISPSAAQTPRRMRMGWLSAGTPTTLPGLALLLTYLSALGWRVGETLEIVDRQAEGDTAKLPHLAGEIVAARPDVIACTGASEATALRAATTDIPIVFLIITDPLTLGIVTSLARPSGNITGIAVAPQFLEGKRLELLVDLLGPSARRFVWLGDPKNVSANSLWADAAAAAQNLKVDIARVNVSSADGIEPAFDAIAKLGASGLVVQSTSERSNLVGCSTVRSAGSPENLAHDLGRDAAELLARCRPIRHENHRPPTNSSASPAR